jgi:SPP1 gp7 family putative phage head morphogenesis protein
MAKVELAALPPAEAVEHFRAKGFRIGFAWQDVWQDEHAHAFTVAKAMEEDLLADIRDAVDRAMAEGVPYRDFAAELEPTLRERGWWGRQPVLDPETGRIVRAQLGSPRRLRIIFDTNLRTSYAAGRWERIERVAASRPFLRYVAVLDSRTRREHRAWHGTILPVDHDFWKTHYPPNGWRCRCIVQQLSEADLRRRGLAPSADPAVGMRRWRNPRTGAEIDVPVGIDPGFAYNVGLAGRRLRGG